MACISPDGRFVVIPESIFEKDDSRKEFEKYVETRNECGDYDSGGDSDDSVVCSENEKNVGGPPAYDTHYDVLHPSELETVDDAQNDLDWNHFFYSNSPDYKNKDNPLLFPGSPLFSATNKHTDACLEKIRSNRPQLKKLMKSSYNIRVDILGFKFPIYRIIKVPGCISLGMLQDKVICTCVGWTRNYAGYLYQLPDPGYKDGIRPVKPNLDISFGPVKSNYCDMGMMGFKSMLRGALNIVNDQDVCLADLVQAEGQKLMFYSHLDMPWKHEITVKKISKSGSNNIELLAGENACPPDTIIWEFENQEYYGVHGYAITLDWLKSSHKWMNKEANEKISSRFNIDEQSLPFNPRNFDIKASKAKLRKALRSSGSRKHGTDFLSVLCFQGDPKALIKGQCNFCKRQPGKMCFFGKESTENSNPLMKCSACKNVWYCDRKCQRKDWKSHKQEGLNFFDYFGL